MFSIWVCIKNSVRGYWCKSKWFTSWSGQIRYVLVI